MRYAVLAALILFQGFLVYESREFSLRNAGAEEELQRLEAKHEEARRDYERLLADYEYYSHAENIEKELRARFNYREPDEQMIIIVPSRSSTTSTSR